MRISAEQIATIKQLTTKFFGGQSVVRLFGSRLNDNARGGDYDFAIETDAIDARLIWSKRIKLLAELSLSEAFGDQKIDIVIVRRKINQTAPIYDQICITGVIL
ncbi:MAG: nucleotidyltransferase domain-containing protein [Bacillota bacterium]